MATGTLTNETVEDFPKTERAGAPTGPRETDVDVTLKLFAGDGPTTGVIKFMDYNFEAVLDSEGNPTGETKPVDPTLARQRAGGRVPTLKARGYSVDNGWVIVSRNGALYAKYFGAGMVPAEYTKAGKAVGEAVPV